MLVVQLALALVALPVVGWLAQRKQRATGRWLLLAVIFWPAAIVLLLCLPPGEHARATGLADVQVAEDVLITLGAVSFLLLGAAGIYAALA